MIGKMRGALGEQNVDGRVPRNEGHQHGGVSGAYLGGQHHDMAILGPGRWCGAGKPLGDRPAGQWE
jgi:hypothetical protein